MLSTCLFQFLRLLVLLISVFASLVCVPLGTQRKIFAITAGTKTDKLIIKKKKNNHDKIKLLGKDKLNTIEVLISKPLINSCVSHNKFTSVNNMLREYKKNERRKENPETSMEYTI